MMLARLIVIAGCLAAAAMALPSLTAAYLDDATPSAAVPSPAARETAALRPAATGREVVVPAGAGGHFTVTFDMNGRAVPALIDTGASTVAVNETTARRIGLSPASLVYDIAVDTANGRVKAARVVLKRVRIGTITVDDVDGMVLPDEALSGTLVGMSFLGRLSAYRVENGALTLRR